MSVSASVTRILGNACSDPTIEPIQGEKRRSQMANDRFGTTHWSLIEAYQNSDCKKARDRYLDELARIYRSPVNAYLTRKGYRPEDAEDLTQGFFHEIVLGRALFDKADRKKGRLRNLMFTALRNFVIDKWRRAAEARQHEASTDSSNIDEQESVQNSSDEKQFFVDFFGAILQTCFRSCEKHYVSAGKERTWRAFEAFVWRPIVFGTSRPSIREIASECGFGSNAAAYGAIHTTKQRLKTLFRVEIRKTVADGADAEEEYQYCLFLLGWKD